MLLGQFRRTTEDGHARMTSLGIVYHLESIHNPELIVCFYSPRKVWNVRLLFGPVWRFLKSPASHFKSDTYIFWISDAGLFAAIAQVFIYRHKHT